MKLPEPQTITNREFIRRYVLPEVELALERGSPRSKLYADLSTVYGHTLAKGIMHMLDEVAEDDYDD